MAVKTPKDLYKVLTFENWEASQGLDFIKLSGDDHAFIHFSTEGQLDRIIDKYWCGVDRFVILKIDSEKLLGKLVFEANPHGTNKYYHLYNGCIPIEAVVESKIISNSG